VTGARGATGPANPSTISFVQNSANTAANAAAATTQAVTAICTSPARLIAGGATATTAVAGRVAIQDSSPTNAAGNITPPFDRWRGTLVVLTTLGTGNTATIRAWAVCISP
jgi:hypothetical protein